MIRRHKDRFLEDPALFIAHYFGDKIEDLKDFHLRLLDNATTKDKCLILYPAGHGKTTLVSTLLPIWAICKNPNIRISVIGKNEDEAFNKIARSIMTELQANERLIQDFGPFQPPSDSGKPWALKNLSVAKRTLRAKEPTLAFYGSGSKGTLGQRADWVICDDVINEKNSDTPEARAKVREWFNQSVSTMNLPGGRLTVIGTLFDPEDLYNDLLLLQDPENGEPIYHVQHEDAIVNTCHCGHSEREHNHACEHCGCEAYAEDDTAHVTLWPEWWPWKRLMEQKAIMGTLDFNKRYRNIAVDKSRQVFKEEYVKGGYIGTVKYPGCIDRDYIVGDYADNWQRFCGFDPAVGTTRHAKFCAHITIAMGSCDRHERCLWVVDLLREQLTLTQQVDHIIQQHERYDAFVSRIEANSYQAGLLEAVKTRMTDQGLAYRMEPHYTNRQNKPDPELGVQSMAPWFENGMVHIPWGNPESTRKMRVLVDELLEYPGRTTDTVMALWFAWRASQEGASKYRSYNRLAPKLGETRPAFWRAAQKRRVIRNPAYL